MTDHFVAIIMGSDSDFPTMQKTMDVLKGFAIPYEVTIASAHRTPDVVANYVTDAEKRGCSVFIGAAGMAAHLAGAIAARTTKPVIGVPCKGGIEDGIDALYSTVQMPGGIPVATVAVGNAGAKNAGYLAAQMMALADEELAAKVLADRQEAARQVMAKNAKLQEQLRA